MKLFFLLLSLPASFYLIAVLLFLLFFSWPLFTGAPETVKSITGLGAVTAGTLAVSLPASIFALLLSICISVSVISFRKGAAAAVAEAIYDMLSSIPTVVYGFMGVVTVLPFIKAIHGGSGMSALSASLVLGLVITPSVTLYLIESFRSANPVFREIVYSLGGEEGGYIFRVLLPACVPGIVSGYIVGFSRAVGDTMIALMLAGNAIATPHGIFDSVRTLTSHIALVFAGDFDSPEFRSIFLSGLLSIFFAVLPIAVLHHIKKRHENR